MKKKREMEMKKQFLKSAAILSLAVTAVSTSQPVAGITKSYELENNRLGRQLQSLITADSKRIGMSKPWVEDAKTKIGYYLDLAKYLINKDEFQEVEYKVPVESLRATIISHQNFLNNIKIVKFENNIFDKKIDKQMASMTIEQYEQIKRNLDEAIWDFTEEIYKIQYKNPILIPTSFYFSKDNRTYYDDFYAKYYSPYFEVIWKKYGNRNQKRYKEAANKVIAIKTQIKTLMQNSNRTKDELEELGLKMDLILNPDKRNKNIKNSVDPEGIVSGLLLTEDIPNVRQAESKLQDLEGLVHEFLNPTSTDSRLKTDEKLTQFNPSYEKYKALLKKEWIEKGERLSRSRKLRDTTQLNNESVIGGLADSVRELLVQLHEFEEEWNTYNIAVETFSDSWLDNQKIALNGNYELLTRSKIKHEFEIATNKKIELKSKLVAFNLRFKDIGVDERSKIINEQFNFPAHLINYSEKNVEERYKEVYKDSAASNLEDKMLDLRKSLNIINNMLSPFREKIEKERQISMRRIGNTEIDLTKVIEKPKLLVNLQKSIIVPVISVPYLSSSVQYSQKEFIQNSLSEKLDISNILLSSHQGKVSSIRASSSSNADFSEAVKDEVQQQKTTKIKSSTPQKETVKEKAEQKVSGNTQEVEKKSETMATPQQSSTAQTSVQQPAPVQPVVQESKASQEEINAAHDAISAYKSTVNIANTAGVTTAEMTTLINTQTSNLSDVEKALGNNKVNNGAVNVLREDTARLENMIWNRAYQAIEEFNVARNTYNNQIKTETVPVDNDIEAILAGSQAKISHLDNRIGARHMDQAFVASLLEVTEMSKSISSRIKE